MRFMLRIYIRHTCLSREIHSSRANKPLALELEMQMRNKGKRFSDSRQSGHAQSDSHPRSYSPGTGVWGRKTTTPGVNANEYGCVNFFRILNFSLLVGYRNLL